MNSTQAPFDQYVDLNGRPLDGGYLYFGEANENPETSPITVYWDAAGTQPAAQPVRTLNGYIVRNGSPANIYVETDYSLTVKNSYGQQVYYVPTSADSGLGVVFSQIANCVKKTGNETIAGEKTFSDPATFNSSTTFAGNATFNGSATFNDPVSVTDTATFTSTIKQGETSARKWGIATRSSVTTYPVPSIRPETANSVVALDVMPNGTPTESVGNGYAWIDVCNADVRDNNNAVYGVRLAATGTLVRVASFNYNGATAKALAFGIGSSDRWFIDPTAFHFAPAVDNTYSVGSSGFRISQLYAGTSTINTSDEREKQDILPIDDVVLDAWSDVEFYQYRWIASVAEKGDAARVFVGPVAQRIRNAFAARGLDATKYGLLCFDEWADEFNVIPAGFENTGLFDKDGKPIQRVVPSRRELTRAAGNRWGIRAEQCLFLEAALMRRELKKLQAAS